MIKIRDFTYEIKRDLEIKLEYRDRLIKKDSIECIQQVKENKNFYAVDMKNKPYCYQGYIIDDNNKIVKEIKEIEKMMK